MDSQKKIISTTYRDDAKQKVHDIYIYKVVISVRVSVCRLIGSPIITHELLNQFASNLDWGTQNVVNTYSITSSRTYLSRYNPFAIKLNQY